MKALLTLVAAGLALVAAPASAVDLGIALGTGQTGSTSSAISASQGSSASALLGFTTQNSFGGAASGGSATSVMSGNDQASTSVHQSETIQGGTSLSLGLAGSQNSNIAIGSGQSAAQNSLIGVWLFVQP